MNSGVIASRYAGALLQLVMETGRGEPVYSQVYGMLKNPSLVESADFVLEPELERLLSLVASKGRSEYLKLILSSFCSQYNAKMGRKTVRLTSAVAVAGLEDRLRDVLASALDAEIVFETVVDSKIIGGFRLEVDDLLLDASVSRQIEEIKRHFFDRNRRIV